MGRKWLYIEKNLKVVIYTIHVIIYSVNKVLFNPVFISVKCCF